jgi:hypothetical protein
MPGVAESFLSTAIPPRSLHNEDFTEVFSMIKIVNKRNYKGSGIYIGRPSALGNPFVIGRDGDREGVIRKYRDFLKIAIHNDERIKAEFQRLEELNKKGDVTLICWCAPSKCHGDVIKELIEKRDAKGNQF